MRVVLSCFGGIVQNLCLILSPTEADTWELHKGMRVSLRTILKQRAIELDCPVVAIYNMTSLIEAWKVRSVDW